MKNGGRYASYWNAFLLMDLFVLAGLHFIFKTENLTGVSWLSSESQIKYFPFCLTVGTTDSLHRY